MAYRLSASFTHAALALIFAGAGGWALFAGIAARAGLVAAFAACVGFSGLCLYCWRQEAQRRPFAIRLMGPQRALLYYRPRHVRRTVGLAGDRRGRGFAPASASTLMRSSDLVEDAECVAVRIDGATHWAGRLLSLRLSVESAVAHRPFPSSPGSATSVPSATSATSAARFRFSKNLIIWADMMPGGCYRSLCVQVRCGQRGVMLVEER